MFGYPNWRIDALESVLHFFMLSIYFLKNSKPYKSVYRCQRRAF